MLDGMPWCLTSSAWPHHRCRALQPRAKCLTMLRRSRMRASPMMAGGRAVVPAEAQQLGQAQRVNRRQRALASSSTACSSAPPGRCRCDSPACELVATAGRPAELVALARPGQARPGQASSSTRCSSSTRRSLSTAGSVPWPAARRPAAQHRPAGVGAARRPASWWPLPARLPNWWRRPGQQHQAQRIDRRQSALASRSTACSSAPPGRCRCCSTACELVATAGTPCELVALARPAAAGAAARPSAAGQPPAARPGQQLDGLQLSTARPVSVRLAGLRAGGYRRQARRTGGAGQARPGQARPGQQQHQVQQLDQAQPVDRRQRALASSSTARSSAPSGRRRCSSTARELVATAGTTAELVAPARPAAPGAADRPPAERWPPTRRPAAQHCPARVGAARPPARLCAA